jgi:hypothetical protein
MYHSYLLINFSLLCIYNRNKYFYCLLFTDNGPQSTTATSQIARCALENNLKRSISNPSALEARLEPFKAFTTNDDLILNSFGLYQYGTTPMLILTFLFGPRVFAVNLLCLIQLYRSADVSFRVARSPQYLKL